MTGKSKLYLGIILGSLLVIAGVSAARLFKNMSGPKPASSQQDQSKEFLFDNEPPAGEREDNRAALTPDYYSSEAKIRSSDMVRPVLSGAQSEEQERIFEEKLMRFYHNPAMQAFNNDLRQALGDVSFEDFLDSDFQEKYFKNPQIQKILLEYSKDPAFMNLMQDMVSDMDFMSQAMRRMENSAADNIDKK